MSKLARIFRSGECCSGGLGGAGLISEFIRVRSTSISSLVSGWLVRIVLRLLSCCASRLESAARIWVTTGHRIRSPSISSTKAVLLPFDWRI